MNIDGGCYCGEIRYSFNGEVSTTMQCHCRECQYITGGNPNVFAILPETGFAYTQGDPGSFTRQDIDNAVTRYFCRNCGTAIGTKSPAAVGAELFAAAALPAAFCTPRGER